MPKPAEDLHALFQPDYTPEQLENLGVYDALYRGQAPRLASLGAWKPEWISEHDPKGWAQWYKRYVSGRRIEGEDERQIRRWLSFKARHGGPFAKKPTPRRGWALRNWAIDPSKLVPEQAQSINELLAEHQRKAMQKFVQQKVAHEIENARAQLGDVFPVSCHERVAEAEPGQAMRVAPALSKQAELAPEVQLQEHQQRVSDRITDDDPRLLLYHGLGTGKSLSAIAAAEAAKKLHGGEYGIVVPASLRQNFQKEIKKFTRGSNPEILSYTGLSLGKDFKAQPETLVMDEAQRLKNPGSGAATAAKRLAAKTKRLLLLSGTPITNSPGDLASPLSLLRNETISPAEFEKRFVGYEKKFPGIIPYLRGAQFGEEPYVKDEKGLREMLAGLVDYQPGKNPEGVQVNEETIKVPLSPEQNKIQKAVRTKIPPGFLWKLDQEFPLSREELSKLNSFMTGLRQVSLSTQPFRADKDPLKAFDQSSKLREAMKRLRETLDADPRRKAIIYSNFIDAGIKPYAAALERDKIPYGIFHGGVTPSTRQQALNDYNAGKLRALLLGPAAAEGISTKGTSLIQLLDPYWHESRTQQAQGRGLRFDSHEGLPEDLKNVAVQRYLSSSEEPSFLGKLVGQRRQRTGDEVMQTLAERKEKLNEAFRQILRDVGTEKTSATGLGRMFAPFVSALGRGSQAVKSVAKLPTFTPPRVPMPPVRQAIQTAIKNRPQLAQPVKQTARALTTPLTTQLANRVPQRYRPAAQIAARVAQYGAGGAAAYGAYTGAQDMVGDAARGVAQHMTTDQGALDQVEQRARANMLPLTWSMLAPSSLGGDNTEIGRALRNHVGTALRHTALPYLFSASSASKQPQNIAYGATMGMPAYYAARAALPTRQSTYQLMQRIPAEDRQHMFRDTTRALLAPDSRSAINQRAHHIFEPALPKFPVLAGFR